MLKIFSHALKAGVITTRYPQEAEEALGLRGRPRLDFERCVACDACAQVCPTAALELYEDDETRTLELGLDACVFCGLCAPACPQGAIQISEDFELATLHKPRLRTRGHFVRQADGTFQLRGVERPAQNAKHLAQLQRQLAEKSRQLFGRSLNLRLVDAGSCNGCELEIAALQGPRFDVERLGIHLVASPRHADGLLVTGPVTRNTREALQKTYDALSEPKLVIAVGACGCSGGVFDHSYATLGGVDRLLPVDVYVPGCPPRPQALLHGILMAMGQAEERLGV